MNNSKNAIHRAVQNCPTPTLPAGFQTRIAERIKAERRREERQEKLSYIAMGVTVVALLAFVVIFAAQRLDFSWASSLFAPSDGNAQSFGGCLQHYFVRCSHWIATFANGYICTD